MNKKSYKKSNNYFTLYRASLYLAFLLFGLNTLCHYNSHDDSIESAYRHFNNPLKPTKGGVKCFFRHIFNNCYYKDYLAVNFAHITTFLSYSNNSSRPKTYIKSVFKIFSQKIKSSTYINGEAFLDFLNSLPLLMQNYINNNDMIIKDQIQECIYNFLLESFDELKKDPKTALKTLSDRIYTITLDPATQEDITSGDLQFTLIQFLDLCLNKLIWSPVDQAEVWNSVKKISTQLENLCNHKIIPNNETLNELYWSLMCRFCYFLEIAGSELNTNSINIIHNDINTKEQSLWSLSEQEYFMKPKKAYLKEALFNTYAASKARQAGLIVDTLG